MSENEQPAATEPPFRPFVAHEVTDEKRARVRTLAKVCTKNEVAASMGFSVDTLQRHYLDDYDAGHLEAVIAVKTKLLTAAMNGGINAMVKFLNLVGAGVPFRHEHTGLNGGPIQTVDLSRLTKEELEQYGRLAAIAEGLDPDALIFEHVGPPAR